MPCRGSWNTRENFWTASGRVHSDLNRCTGRRFPKPNGGIRKLGIPTAVDRIIQQAIAQRLVPIYELLFSDGGFGYRPHRSAQQAVKRIRKYAEQGYTQATLVDLFKYFDTLNHDLLMNLLRKTIHDKRVIDLIKRYVRVAGSLILTCSITNERLVRAGYYCISDRYESLYLCD